MRTDWGSQRPETYTNETIQNRHCHLSILSKELNEITVDLQCQDRCEQNSTQAIEANQTIERQRIRHSQHLFCQQRSRLSNVLSLKRHRAWLRKGQTASVNRIVRKLVVVINGVHTMSLKLGMFCFEYVGR